MSSFNRREFLKTSFLAGAAVVVHGCGTPPSVSLTRLTR